MRENVQSALDTYGFRVDAIEREANQEAQAISTCVTALVSLIVAFIIYEIWKYS